MSGKYPKWLNAPVLLGLLFIGLKLTGVINWPWVIVTLPLWFGWALGLGLIAIYMLGLGAYALLVGLVWLVAIIAAKVRSR